MASTTGWRVGGLVVLLVLLVVAILASVALGARSIPLSTTLDSLFGDATGRDADIIRSLRIPRTLLGIGAGIALGLGGAVLQALTRNPLADPGILGVNAGAAAAVVTAIAFGGIDSLLGNVWFGLIGAGLAMFAVYSLGGRGHSGATPVRLALAGTAVTFALTAYTNGIALLDTTTYDQYRYLVVGSLANATPASAAVILPLLAIGTVLALSLAWPLNAIALGEDTGRALGARIGLTRGLGMLAATILCGGATAAIGPVAFLGLTVPHIARAIGGPDQRWVLTYSLLLSPVLMLAADIVGRLVLNPAELQVAIVTPLVGAPLFVMLVRRRRIPQL